MPQKRPTSGKGNRRGGAGHYFDEGVAKAKKFKKKKNKKREKKQKG